MTSLPSWPLVCLSFMMTLCSRLSFCIGSAISWNGDHFKKQPEQESFSSLLGLMFKFSSGLDFVFNCVCFIYIGAWLPFDKFHIPEIGVTPWRLVTLMLIILTLRRIPSLLLLYKLIPEIEGLPEAIFCGYFGPVSVLWCRWYKLFPLLTPRLSRSGSALSSFLRSRRAASVHRKTRRIPKRMCLLLLSSP